MKTNIIATSCLLALCLTAGLSGHAQGTFQNLNFESASVPGGTQPGSLLPISSAFPGWSAYAASPEIGMSNAVTQIPYDDFSLGGSVISVLDANTGLGFAPLQGNYSAALFGGSFPPWYTIYQAGLVPAGTRSLQLAAYSVGASFVVKLGAEAVNMVPLSTVSRSGFPGSYTIYGGDMSSFAGQAVQLSITELPPSGTSPSELFLDNIVFSENWVPEPGTWELVMCGVAVFASRRRR
jgi:hypothetical protein